MRVRVSKYLCPDATPLVHSPGFNWADSSATNVRSDHCFVWNPHVSSRPVGWCPTFQNVTGSDHSDSARRSGLFFTTSCLSPYSPDMLSQLLKISWSFLPPGLCRHHSICFQHSSPQLKVKWPLRTQPRRRLHWELLTGLSRVSSGPSRILLSLLW